MRLFLLLACLWASIAHGAWLLTPGSTGGGADCTSAPTLLCLAGRSGTANNVLLSTDDSGTITGTALSGTAGFQKGLVLNATTATDLSINPILLNDNVTSLTGIVPFFVFRRDVTINDDAANSLESNIFGFLMTGTWTIGDDSLGGPKADFFNFVPTFTNPTGVNKRLGDAITLIELTPTQLCDTATCTTGRIRGALVDPQYTTNGGGTLTVSGDSSGYEYGPNVDTGVTAGPMIGFQALGVTGAGTISDDIGMRINTSSVTTRTGTYLSVESVDGNRVMRHAGPAVFGTDAAATNVSVGLEVQSTSLALLLSRMTTTQQNALTATAGMEIYNTTLNTFADYENGAWLARARLHPDGGPDFRPGATPSCGTGCASVAGNDRVGDITVSSGVVTSVTVNFSATLGATPICLADANNSAISVGVTSVSTSAVTFGASATLGSGHIYFHCLENA